MRGLRVWSEAALKKWQRTVSFACVALVLSASLLEAAEPQAYLQANEAAQAHAANPTGWVAPNLKTVTAPGDGNTWSGGKVLVRAFTNPYYYNLTTKKNQNLYPGALWVTTGNELPAWYRDQANSVTATNISRKTVELLGLPTASMQQYNAIVEILVDPSKLIRPTRDPNIAAQPTALPLDPFAARPANLSQADYDAFKAWYVANITSSYGAVNPDNRYPWTQLGYTYNWSGDQASLASINGLSEFVVLGTRAGVTSPLETFAVYSIESYLYRVGTDGDGIGNFNITGPLDTLWSGTKFQPGGDNITVAQGAVVSGGEGIYLSSGGYTVTNNGSIIGPTAQKYYGDGPAGTSVYFLNGGTLINGTSGIMSGDGIAIGGHATGQGVHVSNYGFLSGASYAMRTGAGNDSLTIENAGTVRGSVALGTGADQITVRSGASWQPVINAGSGSASTLQSANILIQSGSVLVPYISGTGLLPSTSSYSLTQGSLTGNFSTVLDQYPLFDFSTISSGGTLSLVVTRIPYATVVAAFDPGLVSLASDLSRQLGAASADMAQILSTIDAMGSAGAIAGAMRQLGPGTTVALPQVSFAADRTRLTRLQGYSTASFDGRSTENWSAIRYAALPPNNDADPSLRLSKDTSWKGFALATGGWGYQESEGLLPGFRYDSWSSQAGIEKQFSSSLLAGFALNGAQFFVTGQDAGASSVSVDSINPVLFSTVVTDALHTDLLLGYSYNRYTSDRRIVFGGIDRTASASYDGHQLSALVNVGYRFMPDAKLFVEPVVGMYLAGLFQGGYGETGAGAANLRVSASDYWSLRSHMGPRIGTRFKLDKGELELQLSAFWNHEFNTSNRGITASFAAGTASSFTTDSLRYDADSVDTTCKLQYQFQKDMNISAEYALNASAASLGNSMRVGLEWKF